MMRDDERDHVARGVAQTDPDRRPLAVHGRVRPPMLVRVEDVRRPPMTNRVARIEWAGDSPFDSLAEAQQRSAVWMPDRNRFTFWRRRPRE